MPQQPRVLRSELMGLRERSARKNQHVHPSLWIDVVGDHAVLRFEEDAIRRRCWVGRKLFERVTSLRHSSKKTKFFFGRYLAYARDVGDAALVKHVKERARAWVESQAGGGDE